MKEPPDTFSDHVTEEIRFAHRRIRAASDLADKVLKNLTVDERRIADQAAYQDLKNHIPGKTFELVGRMPILTLRGFFVGQIAKTTHLAPEDSRRLIILRQAHEGLMFLARKEFEKAQECADQIVHFQKELKLKEDNGTKRQKDR